MFQPIELSSNSKVTLLRDMTEQDWNPLAGRDVEVNTAKENKRDSVLCWLFFYYVYFCSFLTFVDYLNYPAKSLKNIKETFVLSSFHWSSSRWNQEGKKFSFLFDFASRTPYLFTNLCVTLSSRGPGELARKPLTWDAQKTCAETISANVLKIHLFVNNIYH